MGRGVSDTDTDFDPVESPGPEPDDRGNPNGQGGHTAAPDPGRSSSGQKRASRPSRPASRRRAASSAELDRSVIRRVLIRRATVAGLDADDLRLAGGLLGCGAEVHAVTEASLLGGSAQAAAALKHIGQVAEAGSDMDALIEVIELGPDRIRAVNSLLASIEDRSPLRLHTSEAKAARQLTLAIRRLPPDSLRRVGDLAALLA